MIDVIMDRTGAAVSEVTMVGDRLYTDIAMGRHGLRTVLVLTGETTREDIPGSRYKPDLVVGGVEELYRLLEAQSDD
jgi:ribonucleotide monophosphatase NagD (HAD superfamily)